MPGIKSVSFTDPATVDLERIRRQQALAMQLQQQSEEPLASGQMAGGYFVPTSPLSHLAKALKGAQARRSMTESDEELKALGERQAGQRQMSLEQALRAARGTPATEASEDPAGNYMPGQAAVGPNPQGALDALMRSQDPGLQNVGLSQTLQQILPKRQEPFTLAPGAVRYNEKGQQVAQAPHRPEKPDEFTTMLRAAGIDPGTPEGQRLAAERLKKMTTHPAAPNVKVDVKTGESLGKEIGPIVAESRSAALGSLDAIDTAARIRTAISGGNVTLGPTATVRNQINQIAQVMGIAGGSTEEKLVNTREVARGLAQFTVAARKALKGQGQVSDFEGKLLQRAESGNIADFTIPELKSFIAVTERLARKQYGLHKSNIDVMRKRPDLSNLVPFYEVPELQNPQPEQRKAQRAGSGTVVVDY